MKRRKFLLTSVGLASASQAFALPASVQVSSSAVGDVVIGPEVFAERLTRLRALMVRDDLRVLFLTPGTNFTYLNDQKGWRSERLVALLVRREGDPFLVLPSFERENLGRRSRTRTLRTWEEEENPFSILAAGLTEDERRGRIGIEPTTNYSDVVRLRQSIPDGEIVDGTPLFEELRSRKTPVEVGAIRGAIRITQDALRATFNKLSAGMTEQDVAGVLAAEMLSRGGRGGGLVQFGPSSALPHGGPTASPLQKGTVVLIDCGCTVAGYTSDITRTIWWGSDESPRFRKVYDLVAEAQRAAFAAARPGMKCEELDQIARAVISDSGFGTNFTHRLGHGIGLDGHEAPYLVKGNRKTLEAGNVITIEPGIYLPGEFGVRIEDDFLITADGVERLSTP